MSENTNLNVAVIGGGPGGYAAAFLAADLGMNVTLIDPEVNPGGVCLYRGCIPSKALLHVAKLIEESQQAKNWGIEFNAPKIDLAGLRSFKEGVVKKLTGGLGVLSKQRKVRYVQGRAAFESSTHGPRHEVGWLGRIMELRSHHYCDRLASRGRTDAQTRHAAHDGLHRRLELEDIPGTLLVVAVDIRPRTRLGLRGAGHACDRSRNAAGAPARRRSGPRPSST